MLNPLWISHSHYRNFLLGLRAYGRGNWKSISKDFVTTKTAVQVSSHAQKYFRRQESTTKKQRYSINDVGLYDAKPWLQDNSSSREAMAFNSNAYNPYAGYGSGGQLTSMDNLTQVYSPFQCPASQVGSSQSTVTWIGGQQTPIRSSTAPMMEKDGTQMEWAAGYY